MLQPTSAPTTAPLVRLSHRALGLFALLTAPAMTVEAARHGFERVANEQTDPTGALLYGLFALGWLASLLGLWQLRATGDRWGRLLLALTLVTVTLAVLQSPMDLLPTSTGHPLYLVTDLAWPLSMLLTLFVGVAVAVMGRLKGWKRFVPLYCGISVPLALGLMALGVDVFARLPYAFEVHTVTGWALLGYVVFSTPPAGAEA